MSIFGKLFDFNHDGELDGLEKAVGLGLVLSLLSEEEDAEDESDQPEEA